MPRAPLPVSVAHDTLRVGPRVGLTFQRTLRVPDDGRRWPLPPGFGAFPLRPLAPYAARVPAEWAREGGFLLPMWQREAMWLAFEAPHWHPSALKVGVGAVDALTGAPWTPTLAREPQDYVVVPQQPWLDGINAGEGWVRQFVAAPLGRGLTVEAQVAGREDGGLRLLVVPPVAGRFRDAPRRRQAAFDSVAEGPVMLCSPAAPDLGLAAGGGIEQRIHPDPHPADTWDLAAATEVRIRIVNAQQWTAITGEPLPPTPIDVDAYRRAGLPWFARYHEALGDVAASARLRDVRTLDALDPVPVVIVTP